MVYISADIDVDIDDVLSGYTSKQLTELVGDLLSEGHVPDGWVEVDDSRPEVPLDDPAVLLGVITELRKRGYTVEPGAI